MQLISAALRRPITVFVTVAAIALAGVASLVAIPGLAVRRIPVDILPALDLPVIYVCQPYGGMDPAQMEGLITNYYEYHFLYVGGIKHVESRNVQGVAVMKLVFHPGTNMAQAIAETIAHVNRSRAFMPAGTVPPFVMRFDTGSVPVGYLVLSSESRTLGEIQDLALFRVRPMFSSLPGVSAPPPFGGSQRSVVIRLDPDRLRSCRVSPDEVITALAAGNTVSPSGNVRLGDRYPIVPVNATVKRIDELGAISVGDGRTGPIFLRDLAVIEDTTDLQTGYALADGRRAIYILATKRSDASTLDVVRNIKAALPDMQKALPDDIKVSFEFDQSPVVTGAVAGLVTEGTLGAALTGLVVLIFLRDWRSALVVVLNIPLAILAAVVGLQLTGQTINLMTLSGLALAVGILVDEATVEIENIHRQLETADSVAVAVRRGNEQTATPRLFAMLAVFAPTVFMQGAARGLFLPMSLAIGFAMVASWVLSNTLVPVLATLLLKPHSRAAGVGDGAETNAPAEPRGLLAGAVALRHLLVPGYLVGMALLLVALTPRLGSEIFPRGAGLEFRVRLRAPDGTHFERTETIVLKFLDLVNRETGAAVERSLGYAGMIPSSYPINAVYQWSRGPEEAVLKLSLKPSARVRGDALKERLRAAMARELPDVRISFEPGDILSDVMSFGSPTPIEVAVSGPSFDDSRAFAGKVREELTKVPGIRDLQYLQSLDYPSIDVKVDRDRAALAGVSVSEVARSLVAATSSSRFVLANFWPDPKTGVGYQVQVEIPRRPVASADEIGATPIKRDSNGQLFLRDLASVREGRMAGQYDRFNMKREVGLSANLEGIDLGTATREVQAALRRAGEPPRGAAVTIRGQVPSMLELRAGLGTGLALTFVAIYLLLAAGFQSLRLPLVALATAPAALAGSAAALLITGDTINVQSFIGTIMVVGVAMANAILLLSFARAAMRRGATARDAAASAVASRFRPIVMTAITMMAGMLPMALGLGESGSPTAPLGRAAIGGLLFATLATLLVLPSVFALAFGFGGERFSSLDPADPESPRFDPAYARSAISESAD
jgi:multidrug efflux pump subunit AcrB